MANNLPPTLLGSHTRILALEAERDLAVGLAIAGHESTALSTLSKGIATTVVTTQAFKAAIPIGGEPLAKRKW